MFSGLAIQREIEEGRLSVAPFDPARLRAASYVLSLGGRFRRWHRAEHAIVPWSANATAAHLDEPFQANGLMIMPGEFVLACTAETICIGRDRFGAISPLSHIARFGLGVHGGADFINPGHGLRMATCLTLELYNYNPSPLQLTTGMPIAHLRIGALDALAAIQPNQTSIYEGLDPLTAPRLFEEWAGLGDDAKDA